MFIVSSCFFAFWVRKINLRCFPYLGSDLLARYECMYGSDDPFPACLYSNLLPLSHLAAISLLSLLYFQPPTHSPSPSSSFSFYFILSISTTTTTTTTTNPLRNCILATKHPSRSRLSYLEYTTKLIDIAHFAVDSKYMIYQYDKCESF